MVSRIAKCLAAATLFVVAFGACANDAQFYYKKEEGWFWYDDPRDAEPPVPEELAVPEIKVTPAPKKEESAPPVVAKKPDPFSVAWLKDNLPKLLDMAIEDPTRENVEAYLYAQRVTMDKAQRYAQMTQQVVYSDPYLDENNRFPMSTFAKPYILRGMKRETDAVMKHLAGIGGIWFFFDSKCEHCYLQQGAIKAMREKYGFITKNISVDGVPLPGMGSDWVRNQGQAQTLGLKLTPTTVLAVPPNNYLIVSQGYMAEDTMTERILVAAESHDLIPKDMLAKLRVFNRGVLSPSDLKGDGVKLMDSDDPRVWVDYLKKKLEGRY